MTVLAHLTLARQALETAVTEESDDDDEAVTAALEAILTAAYAIAETCGYWSYLPWAPIEEAQLWPT